jgi:hypothetical protein
MAEELKKETQEAPKETVKEEKPESSKTEPKKDNPKSKAETKKKPKKYRSFSHMIIVFEHRNKRYTIYPNSIVENLPENASQVKKLIKRGLLKEVK